jgi:curved DNA-binding protein CbpA
MTRLRRAFKDYYQILGVPSDASPKMIKKAYRRLARANHPDHNPGDPAAVERFREISEAYEVLADVARHEKHDQEGRRQRGSWVSVRQWPAATSAYRRIRGWRHLWLWRRPVECSGLQNAAR